MILTQKKRQRTRRLLKVPLKLDKRETELSLILVPRMAKVLESKLRKMKNKLLFKTRRRLYHLMTHLTMIVAKMRKLRNKLKPKKEQLLLPKLNLNKAKLNKRRRIQVMRTPPRMKKISKYWLKVNKHKQRK